MVSLARADGNDSSNFLGTIRIALGENSGTQSAWQPQNSVPEFPFYSEMEGPVRNCAFPERPKQPSPEPHYIYLAREKLIAGSSFSYHPQKLAG